MEADGFQLVTSKKKSHRSQLSSQTRTKSTPPVANKPFQSQDVSELERKVEDCKEKLATKDNCFYWSKLQLEFRRLILDLKESGTRGVKIICYGLGSVDENLSARYQFALLLLLVDELKSMSKLDSVELFDPVFTPLDIHLFTHCYPFKLADRNDQCFRPVNNDQAKLTMFYMPHCGKALYNNLLYSNWNLSSLNNMLILGNSFSTIQLNTLDCKMQTYYPYVRDSLGLVTEISLAFDCEYTNAFTDLCFLRFPTRVGLVLPQLVNELDDGREDQVQRYSPVYEPAEEIF